MPITLTEVVHNTAKVSFPFSGDTVNVTYYPSRITERFMTVFQIAQTMDAVDTFKEFNSALANVIDSWDVYATPEDFQNLQPFPIDPDRFPDLPIALRMQVYAKISEAIGPETFAPQTMTQNS